MRSEELLLGIGALALMLSVPLFVWRKFYVMAQPDEWLLRLRNGRLLDAGVGIAVWRRPGDVLVRFSSTLQRVGFSLDALTSEHVSVKLEGFLFWSVDPSGDAPFRAYQKLGLANMEKPPYGLKHPKHLLTSAQHKAFVQILSASTQRLTATVGLKQLLDQPDQFVRSLHGRLQEATDDFGVRIDQVQLLRAAPSDPLLLEQLRTQETERLREEAARLRRDAADRIAAHEAQAALALEQQRTALLDAQRTVRERELAQERELKLLALEAEEAVQQRALVLQQERAMAQEANARALAQARAQREREEREAQLEQQRAEALAQRDVSLARTEAEAKKPAEVRQHELAMHVTDKLAQAFEGTDTRWISVGDRSPVTSVAAMVEGVRTLLS